MRLRTFTAPDMPEALRQARAALGEHALILSSTPDGKGVTVTAAVDVGESQDAPPYASFGGGKDFRHQMQSVLRFHNLPEVYIAKLLQHLPAYAPSTAFETLASMLASFFAFHPLSLGEAPQRLMLIGMPGAGKTLSVAKIATRLSLLGKRVAVITTDTKRAGGVEQLQSLTNILSLELGVAQSRAGLWRQLRAIGKETCTLIDTAGCNPYDAAERAELEAYATLEDIEPLLVMAAGGDSMETLDIGEQLSVLPVRRLLVTRADSARRLGGVLAMASACKLAFCQISDAPEATHSLQEASAERLARLLLRHA